MQRNTVIYKDLGLVDYKEAWDYQQSLNSSLVKRKREFFSTGQAISSYEPIHYLLCCQHPPVYTLGKSGSIENLLLKDSEITSAGFDYYKINRGGDITYHGPGQLVIYPIFDLEWFFRDVHRYVRLLEEVIINTLSDFEIIAAREEGFTGVWVNEGQGSQRKLCAIGVHLSRWVSMHGLALNVNTNLQHFENIIPCGISPLEKQVSSMQNELGKEQNIELVKLKIKDHFKNLFNFEYKDQYHK